jgi:hypothetical protein
MNEFNYRVFHRRRKTMKILGMVLVLVGLFTIIDMMGEIPVVPSPFRGLRAIYMGGVMLIFGLLALYNGYKLPLEEALDLIHRRSRGITESELVHDLRVDRPTAARILAALIHKGFVRRATDHAGATEEVFEPVR